MDWKMNKLLLYLQRVRPELTWFSAALMLAVVPHALRLPFWMPMLFYGLAAWRLYMDTQVNSRIGRRSLAFRYGRQIVMIVIVVGVMNSYGTLVGRDAGVALLVLLAGMKLLELKSERDYYIASFICMFLVLTNFLYSQNILSALYMLCSVGLVVTAMISLNDRNHGTSVKQRARLAGTMLLQSIPILLLLFILFPRLDGPLWGLPKDALAGTSGLDDQMSPGQISQLSLSNKIAFRVEFEGEVPDNTELYWRGPVMWYSDGVKWVGDRRKREKADIEFSGRPFDYTVTMEATDQNWLYGLEMVERAPPKSRITDDRQILTSSIIRARKRYQLRSYADFTLQAVDEIERRMALQLPQGYHSRARELAKSWRDEGRDSREIVTRALRMFNQEDFYYTLTPPLLLEDNVDQFLFDTRQGFCEHYAASFVILMRAAGVPARVVTGYQGGEMNPVGNYMIVRQRDAHAWSEVWFEDQGWVRIDPTAAVAPERIRDGIDNALPDSLVEIPLGIQNEVALDIWRRLRYRLDALNNRWNQWVLGYDNNRQSRFLSKIGFGNMDWRGMTTSLLILVSSFLVIIAWLLFRPGDRVKDRARMLYDHFCRKLAACGIDRKVNEGPRDFAQRAARTRPDLQQAIEEISRLYINIRYRERDDLLDEFKSLVRAFRPLPTRARPGA